MVAEPCKYPWKFYVEPFKIVENVYYVGNRDVSSYLIDTGDGLVLHDTAYPQTTYLLLESIRKLGFNPQEVRYVLHSHAHYDHLGGTKAIKELTGAETFLGEDDIFIINERDELSWAREYGTEFYEKFEVTHPLKHNDHIRLGNVDIRCLHIPGHTPGSFSYFFDIAIGGHNYTLGTHGGPGLNTLSDEYLRKYKLSFNARKQYIDSLQKLKEEDVDIFLGIHPGQNNTFNKQKKMGENDNPFIDNPEWKHFLKGIERIIKKSLW